MYAGFFIDVFARRIVGWRVGRAMTTDFVLDPLEQALYDRRPSENLIHQGDRGPSTCQFAIPSDSTKPVSNHPLAAPVAATIMCWQKPSTAFAKPR